MEIPIRPKLYSFHEAFNAVGRKLVPGWTGFEINAQKCHPPKDVDSMATLPERLLEFTVDMAKAPDVDPADLQKHVDGVEHARLVRQSATVAREIKDLKEDPEAYQTKYDLWFRHDKAYKRLIDILHDGHAPSWLETTGGDIHEIQRTHWGGVGGPFTPNLPGDCGEYRGAWGEAWGEILIDRKSLDHSLKTAHPTPAAGLSRRDERKKETLLKYKGWSEAATAFKKEHPNMSNYQVMLEAAGKMGIHESTFRKMLKKHHPGWAQ